MFSDLYEIILNFLAVIFAILILKTYFGIFFHEKGNKILSMVCWGMYFIWQIAIIKIVFLPAYANVIISISLVSMIAISSYRGKLLQKIVFSVLINTIWMLIEFLVGYTFVLCGIDYMIPQLLGSLLSKLLTLFLIFGLKQFFQSENVKNLSNKYNIVLLMIPIGSMYVIYNIFMLSVELNNKQSIKKSITSSIMVLVVNIIVFELYLRLSKEKELQKYNAVYEQQLELCTQHMREKETVMMDFRKARHDMKHHYIVLMEMIENNENESAKSYLRKIINVDTFNKLGISRTENVVIDSLVNSKYSIALKQNIKFEIDIHIPMQLPFSSADISILLGNILDNAIEASTLVEEKCRKIKLFMKYETNIMIITVINTFDGNLRRNRAGKIITSKGDAGNHGIGLESVQKVASKYHGSVVIETKEGNFIIKIVLCDIS